MTYLWVKKMNKITIFFFLLTQVLFGKTYYVSTTSNSGSGSFKSIIDSIHTDNESSNTVIFSVTGGIDITNIDSIKTNVTLYGSNDLNIYRTFGNLYIDNAEVKMVSINAQDPNNWNIVATNAKFLVLQTCKLSVDISLNQIDSIRIQGSELSGLHINKAKTVNFSYSHFYGDSASVTIDSLLSLGRVDVLGTGFGFDKSESLVPMLGHALEIKNAPDATLIISASWFLPSTPTSTSISGSGKGLIINDFNGKVSIRYNWFGMTQDGAVQSKLFSDGIFIDAPQAELYLFANEFYAVEKESYCIKVINAKDSSIVDSNRFGSKSNYLDGQQGRGIYLENFNKGVISSNTFCGSEGVYSSSDIGIDYESGLVILSSSNNNIFANSFGVSNVSGSSLLKVGNGMNGMFLGTGSTGNFIRSNYIGSNKHYGIKDVSGGTNKISYNSIACNDSGSFKVGSTQETLNYFNQNLPVLVVDGSGESVSLSMEGMPVENDSKVYIYEKLECNYTTLYELSKSFIDSVTVSNGSFTYTFPSSENMRSTAGGDSKQYFILAAQPTGEAIGSSKLSDIITHSLRMNKQG
ncbi:MAG: hypothetical protein ACJAZ2_002306, partial [Glaciecola sp.]